MAAPTVLEALDAARTERFKTSEGDRTSRRGMAIQNERGAMSLAKRRREEGREEGREEAPRVRLAGSIEAL